MKRGTGAGRRRRTPRPGRSRRRPRRRTCRARSRRPARSRSAAGAGRGPNRPKKARRQASSVVERGVQPISSIRLAVLESAAWRQVGRALVLLMAVGTRRAARRRCIKAVERSVRRRFAALAASVPSRAPTALRYCQLSRMRSETRAGWKAGIGSGEEPPGVGAGAGAVRGGEPVTLTICLAFTSREEGTGQNGEERSGARITELFLGRGAEHRDSRDTNRFVSRIRHSAPRSLPTHRPHGSQGRFQVEPWLNGPAVSLRAAGRAGRALLCGQLGRWEGSHRLEQPQPCERSREPLGHEAHSAKSAPCSCPPPPGRWPRPRGS